MASIGELTVDIKTLFQDGAFRSQLNSMQTQFQQTAKAMQGHAQKAGGAHGGGFLSEFMAGVRGGLGVGAAVIGVEALGEALGETAHQFREFTLGTIEIGAQLSETAKRLQVNVIELQKFQFAGSLAGIEADSMGTALKFLGKNSFEAKDGTGDAAEAFKRLGVSVTDSNGQMKTQSQLMVEVAEGMGKLGEGPVKINTAMKIFGRSGTQILSLIGDGADEVRERFAQFDEESLGMSKDQIDNSKKIEDTFKLINAQIFAMRMGFMKTFGPQIATMVQAVSRIITNISHGLRDSKGSGDGFFGSIMKGAKAFVDTLEDIIVFLAGGRSAIGEEIKKIQQTGKGTDSPFGQFMETLVAMKPMVDALGEAFRLLGAGVAVGLQNFKEIAVFLKDTVLGIVEDVGKQIGHLINIFNIIKGGGDIATKMGAIGKELFGQGGVADTAVDILGGRAVKGGAKLVQNVGNNLGDAAFRMLNPNAAVAGTTPEKAAAESGKFGAVHVSNEVTINVPGGNPDHVKKAVEQGMRKANERTFNAVNSRGGQ